MALGTSARRLGIHNGKNFRRRGRHVDLPAKSDPVSDYINSFAEDSLGWLLANFSPVPANRRIESKIEYFYRPYDYLYNTLKFISYEGYGLKGEWNPSILFNELTNKEDFIDEFL